LEFVSIHPFSDGNGRLARLLILLYLRLRDYDFRGALIPESYYARNRLAYYNALHQSQGGKYGAHIQNNLEPWLDYFIHALHVVARDLDDEVTSLSITPDTSEPILLTRNEITILSYVNQFLAINLAEAEKILDLPTRTIQRYLKNLTDKNLLRKSGKGKKTYYHLSKPPTQNVTETDNSRH
jgi:Fic family protein